MHPDHPPMNACTHSQGLPCPWLLRSGAVSDMGATADKGRKNWGSMGGSSEKNTKRHAAIPQGLIPEREPDPVNNPRHATLDAVIRSLVATRVTTRGEQRGQQACTPEPHLLANVSKVKVQQHFTFTRAGLRRKNANHLLIQKLVSCSAQTHGTHWPVKYGAWLVCVLCALFWVVCLRACGSTPDWCMCVCVCVCESSCGPPCQTPRCSQP